METKRILITAPLHQEPDIFDEYQESLDGLKVPDGYTADRFFVVNNCPEVIPHIRNAEYIVMDHENSYEKTHNDHIWTLDLMLKMGELRNATIRRMREGGYDYWFSVDTDILMEPETLELLLNADKDIVSEIFWTKAPSGRFWCNAWMVDQASGMKETWRQPGLYPCGMTGALTLVKRKVFEAGVDYTRIPNIYGALKGEDRHFCVRAACAGFELWVDSHAPARHLYTRELFNEWLEVKRHAERSKAGAAGDGGRV